MPNPNPAKQPNKMSPTEAGELLSRALVDIPDPDQLTTLIDNLRVEGSREASLAQISPLYSNWEDILYLLLNWSEIVVKESPPNDKDNKATRVETPKNKLLFEPLSDLALEVPDHDLKSVSTYIKFFEYITEEELDDDDFQAYKNFLINGHTIVRNIISCMSNFLLNQNPDAQHYSIENIKIEHVKAAILNNNIYIKPENQDIQITFQENNLPEEISCWEYFVLHQLIRNANRFGDKIHINFSTNHELNFRAIVVTDNGPGLHDEYGKAIEEPTLPDIYLRTHTTRKNKGGLGLNLIRSLAMESVGACFVQSCTARNEPVFNTIGNPRFLEKKLPGSKPKLCSEPSDLSLASGIIEQLGEKTTSSQVRNALEKYHQDLPPVEKILFKDYAQDLPMIAETGCRFVFCYPIPPTAVLPTVPNLSQN